MRWTVLGCVIAAAVIAVVLVTWPTASPSGPTAQSRFTDGNGLVVFEQQPSGTLGTAAPDGSHRVMLTDVGTLQGTDLPVASNDGRYLVNQEGQLVTMGPAGPVSITSLPQPPQTQNSGYSWQSASFADGSKYVEATGCYGNNATQSWVADLIPTAGGQSRVLGTVTDSVGDPANAAALVSTPASMSEASSGAECNGLQPVPDKALELQEPGQPPRTILTAGQLDRVLGVPAGTPVELYSSPNPDGHLLALHVIVGAPATEAAYLAARQETVVITRTGMVVAQSPLRADALTRWSPDGRQIASCPYTRPNAAPAVVTIWTVGGATRTITLSGHHDFGCDQLLWSPDRRQLLYSARVTTNGLTQADDYQRGWTVIDLRTGQAHDVAAPGQPAAWLAVKTGGAR